ncbi:MAG: MBOAT family protein [Bacteroidetes bacterium]|nr:MBOAT family protein [Bacteroidota bacterium]
MLFNSLIFLAFLLIVLPFAYYLPAKPKKIFLLSASYFFYGFWDWRFCFLILFSTILDFLIGKRLFIAKKNRKLLLAISLVGNLGLLFTFKYFNFFIDSFQRLITSLGGELDVLHIELILPVGISFYTFQTLSYTIDIYRNKLKPTNSFLDFALFVAFFPQLVAGPIERARNLLPQLANIVRPASEQIREGITLITLGMFLKVIIGDNCGRIVDAVFQNPESYAANELLMAIFLFSLQIYADFAGYSKIARGTAKLLGIDLMVNFQQPYLSANFSEFWKRWHISLGSWLKEYLYIPLGGNRNGEWNMYRNLMLTMLLGGLWHGANWTFVIWGGLHGILLAIHKGLGETLRNYKLFNYRWLNAFFVFLIISFVWVFFRAPDLLFVELFFNRLLQWQDGVFNSDMFNMLFLSGAALLALNIFNDWFKSDLAIMKIEKYWRYGIFVSVWLVVFVSLIPGKPKPFIYFQF